MAVAKSKVRLIPLPPIWFLEECFEIAPDVANGLRWLARPREHFSDDLGFKFFNENYAGKPAGSIDGRYYRVTIKVHPTLGGDSIILHNHRVIWGMVHKMDPAPYQVDHKNRKTTDNSEGNLRLADNTRNKQNSGTRADNRSGRAGVSQRGVKEIWRARITVGGKRLSLGDFHSFEAAAEARAAAEAQYFGSFAPLGRGAK